MREHPAAEGGTVGEKYPVILRKLGDFFVLKPLRLRLGVNPRTWVLKASKLPLDHRSRMQERTDDTLYENCVLSAQVVL